ncbi:MAG: PKD domain-containing protein, partial [bacterium]
GNIYDVDATQFFTEAPCSDCAKVAGFGLDGNQDLRIDFAIKHPFPSTLPRRDLHVFDVRGILILPGTTVFGGLTAPINTDLTTVETKPVTGDPALVRNADGYTTHYDYHAEDERYIPNPTPIPGNLNPFKRYFVDPTTPSFAPASPAGWNVMPMGADYETQSFVLNHTHMSGAIPFVFVVDARWGESAIKETRPTPSYYLPAFNRQEAWSVDVAVTNSNLQAYDSTSGATLDVTVKDWQANTTVGTVFPDPGFPNQVPWAGDVARIDCQVPGLSNLVQVTTPVSGGGTSDNPSLYTFDVKNDVQAGPGMFTGLVAVRDQLFVDAVTGPSGLPELPGVHQGLDIKDYSTYQMFQVTVAMPVDDPPLADASDSNPTNILTGATVHLDGSASMDDGSIAGYSWDPGDGTGALDSPSPIVNHVYNLPTLENQHTYTATLTVRDNADQTDTDTIDIIVSRQVDNPPVADARANPSSVQSGGSVTFDGSHSTDDFGIAKYRWNPGDGAGWIDNGTTANLNHTYSTASPTMYTATLEVTDSGSHVVTDTVVVTVTVPNAAPVANLTGTAPTSGGSPLQVNFDGGDSTDDQGIVKFEWNAGDGSGWNDTGAVPAFQHTYTVTSDTDFNAQLRVTDGGSLTNTASTTIHVTAPAGCGLTGISGPAKVNVGETITLTAVGSAASYSWSESSPDIQLVGSTNGSSVQVQGLDSSSSVNDIMVTLTGSPASCQVTKNLTAYKVTITSPSSARKQFVNWAGSSTTTDDVDVAVTASVTPSTSGIAVTFGFTDPDEPSFQYVSGTSWTSGGQTVNTVETDTTALDNQAGKLGGKGGHCGL